jgi:hypothetical protein
MGDSNAEASVWVYEYGEAYDDLRTAFFIDERVYSDPDLAATIVESAEAALTQAGVIYEVEVTSGKYATRPVGVPTWEEFKQRHFVDGVPLPVRPPPRELILPPSWQQMVRAVNEAYAGFRAELVQLLTAAFPDRQVTVSWDRGPLRRSPGSVDWSEESFGFEITVDANIGGLPAEAALDRVSVVLIQQGWELAAPVEVRTGVAIRGSRGLYTVYTDARPLRLRLVGKSPLWRSPAEPGSDFVIEPR